MTRGDEKSADPFWEYAEEIDGPLHGTTQYGQPHARGHKIKKCRLCPGLVYSNQAYYCRECSDTHMVKQIVATMRRLEAKFGTPKTR